MFIPPNKKDNDPKQYQYTLKSFKFRTCGSAEFSVKFGEFDENKCAIKDELMLKIDRFEVEKDIFELNNLNIKLENGKIYMLKPNAIRSADTEIIKELASEIELKFTFVKGFRFSHKSASKQNYAKSFEAEFY